MKIHLHYGQNSSFGHKYYCLFRKKGRWAPCERLISKSRLEQPGRNETFEIKTTKLGLLILVVFEGKGMFLPHIFQFLSSLNLLTIFF